jgi:hypothetical protein
MPVEGMNALAGSSAQIRASMAHPFRTTWSCPRGQRLAAGDAQLQLHKIETRYHLGDRMLHLQAGIHLKKVEMTLSVQYKLHRTCIHVTGLAGQLASGRSHALPQLLRNGRRGRPGEY